MSALTYELLRCADEAAARGGADPTRIFPITVNNGVVLLALFSAFRARMSGASHITETSHDPIIRADVVFECHGSDSFLGKAGTIRIILAKMFNRPGIWTWALLTRMSEADLQVKVWESDEKGTAPSSIQVFGAVIKELHLAAGGDPGSAEDLIAAERPVTISMPGGRVHSTIVRVVAGSSSKPAVDFAWDAIRAALQAMVGSIGYVRSDTSTIEMHYGPSAVLSSQAVTPVAVKPPRLVELSVVCRPSGRLRTS